MSTSKKLARLARWAFIATIALMGAALLTTAWSTERGVRNASETLVRGQSGVFYAAVRHRLRQLQRAPTDADLAEILADHEPDGLLYLGSFRDGALIASAGEPAGGPEGLVDSLRRTEIGTPIDLGDRVRVVFARRDRGARGSRGGRRDPAAAEDARDERTGDAAGASAEDSGATSAGDDGATSAGDRGDRRSRASRASMGFVLEFEPRVASQLRETATRTLGLGAAAAGALLIVAIGLVRWSMRREELERQLEHERRLAGLGQMSAVLAHEIRNPLASLKGNAQLLARVLPDGDKARTKADRIVGEAIRLETLTNDLLEFARAGGIKREPVDPTALLKDAAAAVGADRVEVESAGAPTTFSIDPARIRQVLVNLIDNAVQASDGPITASVFRTGKNLCYVIRDHGPGIPPDEADRIFEPFFTRKTRGTGLGLAVTKRLVDLHGGAIEVENAADGGAIFRVRIPED